MMNRKMACIRVMRRKQHADFITGSKWSIQRVCGAKLCNFTIQLSNVAAFHREHEAVNGTEMLPISFKTLLLKPSTKYTHCIYTHILVK